MICSASLALSVWLLLISSFAQAQNASGVASSRKGGSIERVDLDKVIPETYRAGATRLRAGEVLKIDGHLDEPAWVRAERYGQFIQRDPAAGLPASEATEFSVAYDDKVVYFAVWCFDSDYRGISASELKRDASLKKGDQIKIIVDPFRDKQNGFFFSTNPLGALKDAQHIDNGRSVNMDWNAVWEVKTTVDERGWYAEVAIPLSQLLFKGSPGLQDWGLNVSRIVIRRNEDSYWVPFPRQWGTPGFSRMSNAGILADLNDLTARRRLEVVPYLSPQVSRATPSQATASTDVRAGFDLRVGLTSTMNADVTYKTDFAQVEADEETINLSRFNLMFPEKRQFFSEPAGLFGYGAASERDPNAGPTGPLAGGCITGRSGAYQVGVMDVQTQATDLTSNGTTTSVEAANFSVIRIKRDLFKQSSVGAIFLNREGSGTTAYNRTVGVDLNLTIGKRLLMTGLVGKTFTPGVSGADVAMAVDALYKTDVWNTGASYVDIPEHFNAEMGFIRRTDIRNLKGKLG